MHLVACAEEYRFAEIAKRRHPEEKIQVEQCGTGGGWEDIAWGLSAAREPPPNGFIMLSLAGPQSMSLEIQCCCVLL